MDNERLREIQIFKTAYNKELDKADTIGDCLLLQDKLDELDREEREILKRFDVL